MKGSQLKKTLLVVGEGELYDIFNLLPEVAGGEAWLYEIKDCVRSMGEWLDDERDYELDDLRDLGGQWANSECEDYHSNINKRVQDLSLWASNDLDVEVQELGTQEREMTLTSLNSLYLYCAMWQLWDAVADQVFQNTEEEEE